MEIAASNIELSMLLHLKTRCVMAFQQTSTQTNKQNYLKINLQQLLLIIISIVVQICYLGFTNQAFDDVFFFTTNK